VAQYLRPGILPICIFWLHTKRRTTRRVNVPYGYSQRSLRSVEHKLRSIVSCPSITDWSSIDNNKKVNISSVVLFFFQKRIVITSHQSVKGQIFCDWQTTSNDPTAPTIYLGYTGKFRYVILKVGMKVTTNNLQVPYYLEIAHPTFSEMKTIYFHQKFVVHKSPCSQYMNFAKLLHKTILQNRSSPTNNFQSAGNLDAFNLLCIFHL